MGSTVCDASAPIARRWALWQPRLSTWACTAVAGLAAKPMIDIDVLLRRHDDLAAAIQKLYSLG